MHLGRGRRRCRRGETRLQHPVLQGAAGDPLTIAHPRTGAPPATRRPIPRCWAAATSVRGTTRSWWSSLAGSGTPHTRAGGDTVASVEFEPDDGQRDAKPDMLVRGVASAPLTFAWLLVLFVTTRIQRSAGRGGSRRIQRRHSTNLRRLRSEPSRVLAKSLFWTDDRRWWPYVPMFVALVAPAERRLRWWRWLLVGIAAHVIATYVGQGYLRHSISRARAPTRLVNARDVG